MIESQLRDARVITQRMLCIGALLYRREMELRSYESDTLPQLERDDLLQSLNRLHRWVEQERLDTCLTPIEQTLIHMPLGDWTHRAVIKAGWRIETLGVLLWALRLIDVIPTFDTRFTFAELEQVIDIFNPTIDLLWFADLRPNAQLVRMRDTAELWDWRCRAAELIKLGVRPSEGVNYSDVIRVTAEQAIADGTLTALLEGDFPAFGRPFAAITRQQYDIVRTISAERYSVMCWVMESSAEWDSLPSDL